MKACLRCGNKMRIEDHYCGDCGYRWFIAQGNATHVLTNRLGITFWIGLPKGTLLVMNSEEI